MDPETIILIKYFVGATVLYTVLIILFLKWRRIARFFGFKVHVFEYRNPADRTCSHCGLHQNEYITNWADSLNTYCWWETMYPLPHSPEKCWGMKDE